MSETRTRAAWKHGQRRTHDTPVNAAPPARPDDAYDLSRPGFEERVSRLAGQGGYRMPVEGHSTKPKALPEMHLTAAALAYARQERGNFGPDVAIAVALNSDAHRHECIHALADILVQQARAVDSRPFLYAAMAAWDWLVHGKILSKPKAMPDKAWAALFKLAVTVMDNERLAAIQSARRAA